MTKQQKTALNMAKFSSESVSAPAGELLTSLIIDAGGHDLCAKLHDDARSIFSVHCPRDWMNYRLVT